MICVPLKSSLPAQWSKHISAELHSTYGQSWTDFKKDIEAFDRMRDAAMGITPSAKGLSILYRYCVQLQMLSLHISMSPCKTEFTWLDLFSENEVSQPSEAFEKVCVLFNLAACLSHIAKDHVTANDYKSAYHSLCCAAGIFDYAGTNFIYTASIDVDSRTLTMLSELMLAQAQHCFFLKAKESPTANAGLLAKLASSAVCLYTESISKLKAIYDEEGWGEKQNIQDLEKTLKAVKAEAQLAQATYCESSAQKYGEAIAHLQEAKKLVSTKGESEEINVRIKALVRNNDLIYHDRIPAVVPEIKTTQTAKRLLMKDLYPQESMESIVGQDVFARVVPLEVHEKSSLYSEMKMQFLREQQEKSEIAGMELTSALEFMKLPASISRLRQPISEIAEVPPEVSEWSVMVSSSPSNPAKLKKPNLDENRQRILSLLKSQQNVQSTGAITNIHAIKQSLIAATKSDTELQLMYDQMIDTLTTLADRTKLQDVFNDEVLRPSKNAIPDISLLDLDSSESGTSQEPSFDAKLDEVASLTAKLHKIQTERQTTLADLREKIHKDDITAVLVSKQSTPDLEKTVLEPELRKFESSVRRIDATLRLQKSVLNDVAAKWKALLASPEAKKANSERSQAAAAAEELTAKFRASFEDWQAVSEGIERAKQFYADLERRAMSLDAPQPPAVPPKPPVPGRPSDGLNGYTTPSAYSPSMYQ